MLSQEASSASPLHLARIPPWPRLHRCGPQVQSPHWETRGVNKSRSRVSTQCYLCSRGERPPCRHSSVLPSCFLSRIQCFFFHSPPRVSAAAGGVPGACQRPQRLAAALLAHPDQEGGCGSHRHARRHHRHHRHNCPVATQGGAQSR